ncbi:extensin family protein [Limimaricola pyoseonensis]|uniref:Uncharacterized conserved protein n=1 Tax=Limimaricola pyoseonensis TaxID=521013 RepID=A0A1G7CEU7_9RHOB|nr:extensin family protein [Limimaricola pyoseonensis]SDE37809.1 Uncharacterized conserved protein [Limimaricola pyoseonensis]
MKRPAWPLAAALCATLSMTAAAQELAPDRAARPVGRVSSAPVAAPELPSGQPATVSRPRARLAAVPAAAAPAAPAPEAPVAGPAPASPPASPEAVAAAPRPAERPDLRPAIATARTVSAPVAPAAIAQAGALCGVPGLEGARVAPIDGAGACGIAEPVRITALHGVRLAPAAVVDCPTARALAAWVDQAAKPALAATGGGLSVLRLAGSYVCRPRNHEQGAQLSEHSFGRAVDISAFGLRDGREISLSAGWNSRGAGAALRSLHKAACGPFGTVLGPDADAAHRDHFHFDTASGRSPYCR